jgi:hypothetical protein
VRTNRVDYAALVADMERDARMRRAIKWLFLSVCFMLAAFGTTYSARSLPEWSTWSLLLAGIACLHSATSEALDGTHIRWGLVLVVGSYFALLGLVGSCLFQSLFG